MNDPLLVSGSTVLSASYDESLIVWDVENACKKFTMQVHSFF